jgi:hypothetical protein
MKKIRVLFFVIIVPILIFALYTWITLTFVYSKGERAGYLQKFSQKGWIFKTWEGELSMINLPGSSPEKFLFSVRSADVAQKVEMHLGQRVNIVYEEHRGIPVNWFGETPHFVVDIKPVQDLQQAVPNKPR